MIPSPSTASRPPSDQVALVGLYEISKILGATLDLEKALHEVLNVLSSFLEMRHGAVVLSGPDGKPALAAVAGMSLMLARSGALKYPFEAVGKVITGGIPLVVPNAAREPLLADYVAAGASLDDEQVSFFCVPVKIAGKAIGALSAERTQNAHAPHLYEHDLRFLAMVATLIGQTVGLQRKVAADRERLMQHNARLAKQMADSRPEPQVQGLEDIVSRSEAMARVFTRVRQAAPTRSTILLRGESGTGKELVARAIHALSPRAAKPLIKLNCATLSESVLESELFGHDKGAFTGALADRKGRFELAHGGSLFLDEIGEITPNFQAKLLRVLQEGEFERVGGTRTLKVDVRLIAATNRDLEAAVSQGTFRADLYYRLNVVPIFLPPLRARCGDIPLLATHFLDRFNSENGRQLTFSGEALTVLQRCYFPGNVRELENCVYRTATMARGAVIDEADLSCRGETCLSSMLWNKPPAGEPEAEPEPAPAINRDPVSVPQSERDRLIETMERCGWVQTRAARMLDLTPRQVGYALKKHNIEVPEFYRQGTR
jgi:Nif-specific regulatory protein